MSHDALLHEWLHAGAKNNGCGQAARALGVAAGHEMAAGMPALRTPSAPLAVPTSGLLLRSGATVGSPAVNQLAESEDESLLESSPRYSSGMDPVQLAEAEDESLLESSRQCSDGMDP